MYRAQNFVLKCRDYRLQRQGRSFWGTNGCMRVARGDLSARKGIKFTSRETMASRPDPVRVPRHFARCGGCWTPKASSPAIVDKAYQRAHRPDLQKQKLRILRTSRKSANYICEILCISQQNLSLQKYGEMHCISRILTVFALPSVWG